MQTDWEKWVFRIWGRLEARVKRVHFYWIDEGFLGTGEGSSEAQVM